MNEELRKLLDSIKNKKQEVKDFCKAGKVEDATKAKEELKDLQAQFDLLYDLDAEAQNEMEEQIANGTAKKIDQKDATKEFADAARAGFPRNSMNEGTNADGGYTVPEDIQTRINTYRDSKASLIHLVDVEPVSTNKGARTFKKRSQQKGFKKVGESQKIGKKETPQFERLAYEIEKYAGYFPVTNELLEDSDANITNTLIQWIGDESRVTRNVIILEQIKTKGKTVFSSLDDIKKAINVTLGSAFKNTSKIVTNDDGFQWFDTLKDEKGNYLLQPVVGDETRKKFAGLIIEVIPNDDLPSDTSMTGKRKIPIIVGDLKEGIKFFDRKLLSIMVSNIASIGDLNAFEEDLTLFRAIEREDCKIKDEKAFVNGEITIEDATVTGE